VTTKTRSNTFLGESYQSTRKPATRKLAAICLIVLAATACTSDSDDPETISNDQSIIGWELCPDNEQIECASLPVPLDYNQPNGETLSIALNMHRATGMRQGILLLNPGGPGGSGVDLLNELIAGALLPAQITDAFDVIGFDPRGVAGSEAFTCGERISDSLNDYPSSNEDVLDVLTDTQAIADECVAQHGDRILHFGSNNVARDMEQIRIAMGEPVLNFLGYSYGTRLGSLYAQLFPGQAGRLVLDASLPPSADINMLILEQTRQMQLALSAWLARCTEVDPDCDPVALETSLLTRVNTLDQASMSDDIDEQQSADAQLEVLAPIILLSIEEPEFAELALAPLMEYLFGGDITQLQGLAEFLQDALEEETSEEAESDAVFRAIVCADDGSRPDTSQYLQYLESYNTVSDLFAELSIPQALACNGWPAAIDPVQPVDTTAGGRILVIGGTTDAATPLVWSEQMAEAVNTPLLVSEHAGHTVVFHSENSCVDEQVIAFLLTGEMPGTLLCSASP